MAKRRNKQELIAELDKMPQDWFYIYRWDRLKGHDYCELIADELLRRFDDIGFAPVAIRTRDFNVVDHRGQCQLQTGICQITEKRICRAIFNERQFHEFGNVLDYEVPLQSPRDQLPEDVDLGESNNGEIDLLCLRGDDMLLIEAKPPNSGESLLRAVLELFVYCRTVANVSKAFLDSYGISSPVHWVPVVLTSESAMSLRMLRAIADYPRLASLISRLNCELHQHLFKPIEFFELTPPPGGWAGCLVSDPFDANSWTLRFSDRCIPGLTQHIIATACAS